MMVTAALSLAGLFVAAVLLSTVAPVDESPAEEERGRALSTSDDGGGNTQAARPAMTPAPSRAASPPLDPASLPALGGVVGPAGKTRARGVVKMDAEMLVGRRGFVVGCGEIAPIAPDLSYDLTVDVIGCSFAALVVDAEGRVASGTGTLLVQDTVLDSGVQHLHLDLVGPKTDAFLEWSELIERSERSLQVITDGCESGAMGDVERCRQEILGPLLEDQAWLEDLQPMLEDLGIASGEPDELQDASPSE